MPRCWKSSSVALSQTECPARSVPLPYCLACCVVCRLLAAAAVVCCRSHLVTLTSCLDALCDHTQYRRSVPARADTGCTGAHRRCTVTLWCSVTGFLGSGKTTFVNQILHGAHGKRFCVVQNEFGATSIDDALLVTTFADVTRPLHHCLSLYLVISACSVGIFVSRCLCFSLLLFSSDSRSLLLRPGGDLDDGERLHVL